MLGFEQAVNADGPMDYPNVELASFARNAGFDDDRVSLDIRFSKHAEVGFYTPALVQTAKLTNYPWRRESVRVAAIHDPQG